jgi:protoporphyrin/coproporphyrin ferrochelatase
VTSAYSSYSGCRQYREDLAAALAELAGEPGRAELKADGLQVDKVRHYYNHPGFVAPTVDAVVHGLTELPAAARAGARVVFVTHSVPTAMNDTAGPGGEAYRAQHLDLAGTVAAAVRERLGPAAPKAWDLAYCSRSGPPTQPWLEPDINDHLVALHGQGVPGVVVVPIGFISDHMEVVFDLDTEAAATAARLGLSLVRVPTVGTDPRFVAALADLLVERASVARGEPVTRQATGRLGPSHDVCPAGCCPNLRGDRPAAVASWVAGTPTGSSPQAAGVRPVNP